MRTSTDALCWLSGGHMLRYAAGGALVGPEAMACLWAFLHTQPCAGFQGVAGAELGLQ